MIHSDFEKGFIKAEIVSFDDLDELGSMAEARAHGKVRQEGKDYVMQDGDVVRSVQHPGQQAVAYLLQLDHWRRGRCRTHRLSLRSGSSPSTRVRF